MKIEKLPFYWRLKKKGSPNIVPDYRPFEFDFIEDLQLVIQKRDEKTLDYFSQISFCGPDTIPPIKNPDINVSKPCALN